MYLRYQWTLKDGFIHSSYALFAVFLKITDMSKEDYIILIDVCLKGYLRLAGMYLCKISDHID